MNSSELKKLFVDICNGFSYSRFYIKHPTVQEEVICDIAKQEALEKAISFGIQKEEDILIESIKNGLWSDEKTKALKSIEADYRRLNHARFNPISENQLSALRDELKLIEDEWMKLAKEKHALFINSAEKCGERAAHDKMILISLFNSADLSDRVFNEESFEYLDDREFAKISREVSIELSKFSMDNINSLAIEPFFQRRIVSDLFKFFGKPSTELTDYQINLFNTGEKFKHMLEECGEIPEEYQNPEGIEDYFYLKRANVLQTEQERAKQKSMWN